MIDDKKLEKFKILGKNVRNIREEKGKTIQEISLKTGITEKYLIRIETGTAKRLNLSHIFDIAHALEVLPHELCEGI